MYDVSECSVLNETAFCVSVELNVCCAMLNIHQDMLVWTSVLRACVYVTVQLRHFFKSCLLHAVSALPGPMLL